MLRPHHHSRHPSARKRGRDGYSLHRAQVWQSAEVLERIVDDGQPADRALHDYFRSHHKMGSNDREQVALTVYGVLHFPRWLPALLEGMPPVPTELGGDPSGSRRQRWRQAVLALLVVCRGKRALVEDLGWGDDARALADAARALERAPLPLAVRADLPDALADALSARLGEAETLALGEALRNQADVDLRVNPLKGTREAAQELLTRAGFPSLPTPYSPVGLRCEERGPLFQMQAFREGWFEVQDEGSQLIAPLLAPQPGETLVDFCAGGGGKTLHLATLMRNQGAVHAFDVSAQRLGNLRPRLRRAGLDNIRMQAIESEADPLLERYRESADGVLVDAPCSGTGTLRRNPDIAWRPLDLPALTGTQQRILSAAAALVKPGGRLVYATCSLLPQENDAVVAAFLRGHRDFRALDALDVLRRQGIALPDDAGEGGHLRLLPHRHGTDGFFGAVLERGR
jgi:16S rRNA (cytosine967-C5)-methyltransferase